MCLSIIKFAICLESLVIVFLIMVVLKVILSGVVHLNM